MCNATGYPVALRPMQLRENCYTTSLAVTGCRRREFMTMVGGAVGWPGGVRPAAAAEIGFIAEAFRCGLKDAGVTSSANLEIAFPWAGGGCSRRHRFASRVSTPQHRATELYGRTRPSSSTLCW
jgi:hypothetical protein